MKHSDLCFGVIIGILSALVFAEPSINSTTSVTNIPEKIVENLKSSDSESIQSSSSNTSSNSSSKEPYESTVTILNKPSQHTIRIPLRIGKALGPPFVKILNRRLSIRLNTINDDIGSKNTNSSTDASDDILSMEIIVNNTSENRTETTRFIMGPYNNSVDVPKTDMSTSHTPSNYTNKGNMSSSSSLFEKLTARILGLVATSTSTTTTPETPTSSSESTSIIETSTQLITKPLSSPVQIHRSLQTQKDVPLFFQSFQTLTSGRNKSNNNNNQKSNTLQDHGHQRAKSTETTISTTKPQIRRDEQRKGSIGGFLGNFFNMFRETRKLISSTFRRMASQLVRFPQEQEEKRQRRIKSELKRDRLENEEEPLN